MDQSQIIKGMLDAAVLAELERNPSHGYVLVRRLREMGLSSISDASVYGTLRRLWKGGYLDMDMVESEVGPMRKFYSVNRLGISHLDASKSTWYTIVTAMNRILETAREQ